MPADVMEKVVETQIAQEKQLKLLVATTTGAVVEEVVLHERRKFPLENLDEFEEREHHMSRALQNNAVSHILN